MSSVPTKSPDSTKSVSRRGTPHDISFSDVFEVGGFPFEQKIKSIARIEVFSNQQEHGDAVIQGLRINYNLSDATTYPIDHGLVNIDKVGDATICENQLLVGVFGQLKDLPNQPNNRRVASIGFVLFNKTNATLETQGPFRGSDVGLGTVYSSFGDIIAFQGARADGVGLTSLGFVKAECVNCCVV